MSVIDQLKSVVTSDGLKVSKDTYDRARSITAGARTVIQVAEEVLDEMSPEDDTPLALTITEAGLIALERLGLKVGN